MKQELSFLVYIDDKPFCVMCGSEQDVMDFVVDRNAHYEPIVTVMVSRGLDHSKQERDA